jgi:hypothetical protein
MSDEEAAVAEPEPRYRRKSDHRKGVAGAAVKASESPWTIVSARLSMVALMPVLGILAWFITSMVDDVRSQMKEQGDALSQILINQAVGITEREDQKRRLTKIEDGMTRLWQHVIGRDKDGN